MTQPILDAPINPLRRRLIDEMPMRRFSCETQRNYTLTHIVLPPPNTAASLRFTFFFAQVACIIVIGVIIVLYESNT